MKDLKIGRMVLGMVQTNCYYVYRDDEDAKKDAKNDLKKEALVFDPADNGDYIFETLTEKGLKIAGIFLTHGHFDHILGAEKLRELSGAKIYAGEAEKEVCENAFINASAQTGSEYSLSVDEYLRDGAELALAGTTFRLLATPGHTVGSVCYYFPADRVLLSGDTLFQESVGRTDLPTGKMGTLVKSVKEKLFTLPQETKVYPGHGEPTNIGFEKQYNPFI